MAGQGVDAAAVVLAAGRGRRMKSGTPKVLHRAGGRPLLAHVLATLRELDPSSGPLVVTSPGERIERELTAGGWDEGVVFAVQDPVIGTADALRVALEALGGLEGRVLVVQGATPLLTARTLRALLDNHVARAARASLVTAIQPNPFGYGRVLRGPSGDVERVVEERDATEQQRMVTEVNAGAYVFEAEGLADLLGKLGTDNDQREYYLPDLVGVLGAQGAVVATHSADPAEVLGVKSRVQLAEIEAVLRRRTCERWMAEGVTIVDPNTTYVDASVTLGRDAVIRPFTFLEGDTTIAEGADVGPQTRIVDSEVGPGATVSFSVVRRSSIGPEAIVGPFASLRPGSVLERGAKVGTFVETKQTTIGEGSKVPHLAYLGDTIVGRRVNVGAGTITANWDGRAKHPTEIEDDAYISSNTVIVAPARVGRRAATGAGAVVRGDVPDDALAVGVPARVIEGKGDRKGVRAPEPDEIEDDKIE